MVSEYLQVNKYNNYGTVLAIYLRCLLIGGFWQVKKRDNNISVNSQTEGLILES